MVRRIAPGDAALLREIRLRALRDSPAAFASSYADEADRPMSAWEERAERCSSGADDVMFVAVEDGECVGLSGGYRPGTTDAEIELISMWVAPDHRGTSVARDLAQAVLDWAKDGGARAVALWVTRGNDRAQAFYERIGFVVTGDVQPLPSDPCKDEVRMLRTL